MAMLINRWREEEIQIKPDGAVKNVIVIRQCVRN